MTIKAGYACGPLATRHLLFPTCHGLWVPCT